MKGDYKYTDTDFHACMLVHGQMPSVGRWNLYWNEVDGWFKRAYSDRWDKIDILTGSHADSNQQDFKEQFYKWLSIQYSGHAPYEGRSVSGLSN